jgi:hypothetical protein
LLRFLFTSSVGHVKALPCERRIEEGGRREERKKRKKITAKSVNKINESIESIIFSASIKYERVMSDEGIFFLLLLVVLGQRKKNHRKTTQARTIINSIAKQWSWIYIENR